MADGRLQGLLPRLIERTRAGGMSWTSLATEGESAFLHQLPEGSGALVVRRLYSTYQLELRSANGAQLESLGEMQEVAGGRGVRRPLAARRAPTTEPYTASERSAATVPTRGP